MPVHATTFAEIRDRQIALIEALVPEHLARERFRRELGEVAFEAWCNNNVNACLRRFAVRDLFEYEGPDCSNTEIELWRGREQVIVAYPRQMARYGDENTRDMTDVIHRDKWLIDQTIGMCGAGNYPTGLNGVFEPSFDLEEGENVTFLRMTYATEFYQARGEATLGRKLASFVGTWPEDGDEAVFEIGGQVVEQYTVGYGYQDVPPGGAVAKLVFPSAGMTRTHIRAVATGEVKAGTKIGFTLTEVTS